jgi:outer membrane protein insertion porin family
MADRRDVIRLYRMPGWRCRRVVAAGALVLAVLGLTPGPGVAAENEEQALEKIDVQGNRRTDVETVRSYFHATPDGRFDDATRDAALKALIATGLFDDVKIDRAGDRLVVHVTEAPVLDKVAFEGNKKIQDKELTAAIESKPQGTLQRAMVQSDVNRIMEVYRHSGRDDVGVKPEIIDRGNGRVILVFEVTEGAKTTVRQINFVGNQVFGKRQLAAVIKTSATNMLSFLTGGDEYDPDRIATDREQLRLYYRSKGYADASVVSAKAEYDPAVK